MKYLCLLVLLLTAFSLFAQIPQKMSYQAVLRDASGELVANQNVAVRISIIRTSEDGIVVYQEEHTSASNANGLITLYIGEGEVTEGVFEGINWGIGPYFIRLEADPDGGDNYSITGTSELVSVPYALFTLGGGGDTDWVEEMAADLVYTTRNIALNVGGSLAFKVNNMAPVGVPRVEGGSSDGIGIQGNTNIGYGVRGKAAQGVGVHGTADNNGVGVLGEAKIGNAIEAKSEGGYGLNAESKLSDGVFGKAELADKAGVHGFNEEGYGVLGESKASEKAGVKGLGSSQAYGVHGETTANDLAGVIGDGGSTSFGVLGKSIAGAAVRGEGKISQGVWGTSESQNGVKGESVGNDGVNGETEFEMDEENLEPDFIGFGTSIKAGVYGFASNSHGAFGNSNKYSGVYGFSTQSNGIFGAVSPDNSNLDRAGVYGVAKSTNGMYAKSNLASGIRATSLQGKAGEFEGELHIENGSKSAKLLIEDMETDNNAPCLVWSGDKYVRKKDCWSVEEEDGIEYFVSNKGIRLKNGETTMFEVNPDGTSYHKGLEIFEGGLEVPLGDGISIFLNPDDGISIFNTNIEDYLFHADPNGNALVTGNLFGDIINARSISAESISAMDKNFKIDHPLDPENKYLYHTSIESSERVNIYSGNITTDENGLAIVQMDEWFQGLNTDFRYQLTVIGSFAQAIIKEEVKDNKFVIMTNEPNIKVSWEVTGKRHDQWAKDHPVKLEELKEN